MEEDEKNQPQWQGTQHNLQAPNNDKKCNIGAYNNDYHTYILLFVQSWEFLLVVQWRKWMKMKY